MTVLSEPTAEHLAEFAACLDDGGFIDASSDAAQPYLVEPRGIFRGRAAAILNPPAPDQVAAILRLCQRHRIGVVPYGGGTGLVGAQISTGGPRPVILSLERMNRIRAVLPEDGVIIAEAGAILADLQAAASGAGRLFPLSLAAQGSCRIGGNLATNAGGVQVLRYGNARDLCLGVEAVLADGSVLSGLKPLRKDNTGYDLRHLLIGSEGTLGVITAASLKLFALPGEVVTAMLAVPSPEGALQLLQILRERLGDGISAFELIAGAGIGFLAEIYPERADPLAGHPDWRVLVEITGPAGGGLSARAEDVLADIFDQGLATDGVLAASEAQRAHMWWMRETMPECNRRVGSISSHDISLPLSRTGRFIADGAGIVAGFGADLRVNCFGHVGDGNLHYNVFPPKGRRGAEFRALAGPLKTAIHDLAHTHGGSISAEHGIGRLKIGDLEKYGDPVKLAAMHAIKAALDPLGIMNPGAVLAG